MMAQKFECHLCYTPFEMLSTIFRLHFLCMCAIVHYIAGVHMATGIRPGLIRQTRHAKSVTFCTRPHKRMSAR